MSLELFYKKENIVRLVRTRLHTVHYIREQFAKKIEQICIKPLFFIVKLALFCTRVNKYFTDIMFAL